MKTKIVNSENPLEHWSDIENLTDKTILDLGCGWLFQEFQNTTEYFISRGIKKTIGVDVACGEIEKLNELFPEHTFICKAILQPNDLRELLLEYRPEVIKMDIEGYESVIDKLSKDDFQSVNEIAVEFHNPECKLILETKLVEFGFEITAINSFGWFITDVNQMGILHAKK